MRTETTVDDLWITVRINRAMNEVGLPPAPEDDVALAAELVTAAHSLLSQVDAGRVPLPHPARVQRAIAASRKMAAAG
ncbi:hypothetical protein OG897_32015 [Streptomyces sp. NBC_00237]|uniref:hypothetical protein n=1 Tax=Streptomyces sp. NBC_00237 TaxID=2975687 RepID=UPI0022579365|nr:hypothetical protein [Streptomyces sp. NBC_00237]MCX5206029.1 hypothetical protein [Streptomyces sp. NBC_00237]